MLERVKKIATSILSEEGNQDRKLDSIKNQYSNQMHYDKVLSELIDCSMGYTKETFKLLIAKLWKNLFAYDNINSELMYHLKEAAFYADRYIRNKYLYTYQAFALDRLDITNDIREGIKVDFYFKD